MVSERLTITGVLTPENREQAGLRAKGELTPGVLTRAACVPMGGGMRRGLTGQATVRTTGGRRDNLQLVQTLRLIGWSRVWERYRNRCCR